MIEQIPVAEVPPTLRRSGDGALVDRREVLRRVGETRHLQARTGEKLLTWCDPLVVGLVRQIEPNHIAMVAHSAPFSIALAAIHYRDKVRLSTSALNDFLRVADLLAHRLNSPCGDGLLAASGDLRILVMIEDIEWVRDQLRTEYDQSVGDTTDAKLIALAADRANRGVVAVNTALHSTEALRLGLCVEDVLLPVVRRSRSEFIATWPDEAVMSVEIYASQVATAFEVCENRAEWLAVATAVGTSCRGGETQPWRSEVTNHFGGALQIEIPSAVGKTGHAITMIPPCMVDVLGLQVGRYPGNNGTRLQAQAEAATRALIAVVHRANDLLQARGAMPFPAQFGLSYAFRRRNAQLPRSVLNPHESSIAVNAMLTHSRINNADSNYDKPTFSEYAQALDSYYAVIDQLTIDPALGPPITNLRRWSDLDRSGSISPLPDPRLWPLVRAVFEDMDLLGVFYALVGPVPTWDRLVRCEQVMIGGRNSLRISGLAQGHPCPEHVMDTYGRLIARREVDPDLADPRRLGRRILEDAERRLEARFRDHDVPWPGPMLNLGLFRKLQAQVADSQLLSPGIRRALLGSTAEAVPHYVTASAEVVRIIDVAMTPLANELRTAFAANPNALRFR
jgi:hypothetical protein